MRVIMPVWATDSETISVTESAIESLKGHPITIIDNGSTVGAGQLREWADVYVRNKVNLGYAKAVNQGLKLHSNEKWVAIANNDIKVSPNWAEVGEEILKDPTVCSVHYRMIPYDQPFNSGTEVSVHGRERWCSSSFFVVRPSQLYDEYYFNTLDDWDFWRRWREMGYHTAYTNKAEYQHLDSYTQQKIPNRAQNDDRNLQHYIDKFGETPDEWMSRMYPEQLLTPWKPMP